LKHLDGLKAWARLRVADGLSIRILSGEQGGDRWCSPMLRFYYRDAADVGDRWTLYTQAYEPTTGTMRCATEGCSESDVLRAVTDAIGVLVEEEPRWTKDEWDEERARLATTMGFCEEPVMSFPLPSKEPKP
jgi:hypothetical protein